MGRRQKQEQEQENKTGTAVRLICCQEMCECPDPEWERMMGWEAKNDGK
jgi:hypothetical protein